MTIPAGDFGGVQNLLQLGTSNDWVRNFDYTNKADIDSYFQPGDYVYSIDGSSSTLSLGAEAYPDTPAITGATWTNAELIFNNAIANSIMFSGPTAGNFDDGTDYLRLTLRAQGSSGTTFIYETYNLANAFAIPAYSLVDGATYDLELLVVNTTDLDSISIPGVTGFIGYGVQTFAELTVSNMAAVPEPSTYAAVLGLAALACGLWRRRKAEDQTS